MQGLTAKQEKSIAALLKYPTLKDAAAAIKITEPTLWRWLQQPEFKMAYRAARREVIEHCIGEMQIAASEAVATLKRNLKCSLNPAVEVRAAQIILEQSFRAVEMMDL